MMDIKLSHQTQMIRLKANDTSLLNYSIILKKFLNYQNTKDYSDCYVYRCRKEILDFLIYLRKTNVRSISLITTEKIFGYLSTLTNYQLGTRNCIISIIRVFLRFCYLNNVTNIDLSLVVPRTKGNHNKKIPSNIWSNDEVSKILGAIDTSTPIGKRDYAVILLVAHLGLRFSDIRLLKFSNVDWQNNCINIVQSKTKKYISLPLLNSVGTAIIDYIKNGRPNSNSEYIFLSVFKSKPFARGTELYSRFTKYIQLAGIDVTNKKQIGLYSLRHTLASKLLEHHTPITTISGILGHTDINNTAIYLKVDISSLRECCLWVEVQSL